MDALGACLGSVYDDDYRGGASLRHCPVARRERRQSLEAIVELIFAEDLAGRVLPFDSAAAREFADIAASRCRAGRPISEADERIAAIARPRGSALATRNIGDFAGCRLELIDPWV